MIFVPTTMCLDVVFDECDAEPYHTYQLLVINSYSNLEDSFS